MNKRLLFLIPIGVLLLLCLSACNLRAIRNVTSTEVPTAVAIPTLAPTNSLPLPTLTNAPSTAPTVTASAPIPSQFQALYTELDGSLTAFDQSFSVTGAQSPVTFGAELLPANGNRGTALLDPQVMQGVRFNLDRLQSLGVQGVTIAVSYPMLTPDFPRSAEYLAFFKNVAAEVHARGMKLDVENGPVFPPPFSDLQVNYAGLTFDKIKTTKRQMVVTIINEIKPDYLDLGAEPDTEARIMGVRELADPQKRTELVNYILQSLDRRDTKLGAGIGTWSSLDFVKDLAANTSLDFIALHVYPVNPPSLQNVVTAADIAHQYNKRVILDEAWLYKKSASAPNVSIAANSEIFRLDTYSFWAPLDQKFLAVIAKLARAKNIEYISPFWSVRFFGYLNYTPSLQTLPYADLEFQSNNDAAKSMVAGNASATGEFYKRLSAGAPAP